MQSVKAAFLGVQDFPDFGSRFNSTPNEHIPRKSSKSSNVSIIGVPYIVTQLNVVFWLELRVTELCLSHERLCSRTEFLLESR